MQAKHRSESTKTLLADWLHEFRQTGALALPIMSGLVGQMLMGITDTAMVGRLGTVPLAAVAFAHNLYNVPMVGGFGLLTAVSILTAHAYGRKRPEEAGEVLRHGCWIALATGLLTGLLLTLSRTHFDWLGQPPEVLQEAQTYLLLVGWSMLPTLISHALKQFCEALARPWEPMLILLGGVLFNILLNWVLIFGHWGAPALGVDGAGLATLLARVATALGMFVYVIRCPRVAAYRPRRWRSRIRWAEIQRQLAVGLPAAVQHLLEVGAFVAAALMMGWISPMAMAAHQVAITCAATTFMFALGIGMATSIRVGHAWGAQEFERVHRVGFSSFGMTALMMACFGLIFLFAGQPISAAFVREPEVVALAARMLVIAAIFQVFDGLQVVAISALRGMADVRVPAVMAAVAYWVIALPSAYLLAFDRQGGAIGVWIGLALGLATAAVTLILRFHLETWRMPPAAETPGSTE